MEFHEKLQELRKQKGLTQEELGEILYVSRTAISKWELGRGYPNLDSLKSMARFFGITIDELLSCDELLCVAEQDGKQKENRLRDWTFALLDISILILLFLPFFAQNVDGIIYEVSIFGLTEKEWYLKASYFAVITASVVFGILQLSFKSCQSAFWNKRKRRISLVINIVGILLFSVSLQPYATVLLLSFLLIKVLPLIKA